MKKILLLVTILLLGIQAKAITANAEDISYPFDSITIVEAFKFDVEVTTAVAADSLLYGLVEVGDILTVYVGTLEFVSEGVPSSGSANVLIISNAEEEDLVQFLVNNYAFYEGASRSWGFASHILIDPEVGVFKDMTILNSGLKEMSVFENIALGTWTLFDNKGLEMPFIAGTYAVETGLSIQISAYAGTGE
jgi:hypothetical protein